ncbi:MAG: hypothetical protein AAB429_01185 [Patescibacteria group bacterium]
MENQNQFYTEPDLDDVGRDPRTNLAIKILRQMQDSLENALAMLQDGEGREEIVRELSESKQRLDADVAEATGLRTIEGVFDGCDMVGSDGQMYNVPPNYASKSRLVEGDMLKLVIRRDGGFVFKQIGPMERRRVVGRLAENTQTGDYVCVGSDGTKWRLILAAVTYYHGAPGDEVVILVPKGAPSTWWAVENIVKR